MAGKTWIGPVTKIFMLLLLGVFGLYIYNNYSIDVDWDDLEDKMNDIIDVTDSLNDMDENQEVEAIVELENYLPVSEKDIVIEHQFYTLSYSEKDEQAKWVAYELSRDRVNSFIAERTDNFREDSKVESGSAKLSDYRGSGYDRGHLCPAGDMTFSRLAMSESFYMSNMSPQDKSFNRGVWKELEAQTRDWARSNKHIYVVTGPILGKRMARKIGDSRVSVPKAYYKVLLDLKEPEQKAIAFVIPNEKQTLPLDAFAMSIDDLEAMTSIDFFPSLPNQQENELESSFNPSRWMFDEDRYRQRLDKWNEY
jgi:endonuclease G